MLNIPKLWFFSHLSFFIVICATEQVNCQCKSCNLLFALAISKYNVLGEDLKILVFSYVHFLLFIW